MIKVALLGAPSSGKTATAQDIKDGLPDFNIAICDDYVPDIEQRSDNTLGHFASYLGNLQVALGRWERERMVIRDEQPDILITCGTVVETTVYEAIDALAQANTSKQDGTLTLRALQNDKRASVTMTILGIIAYDTWDYDYAYHLPLDDNASASNRVVNDHIAEAADALGVQVKEVGQDAVATIVQDILAHGQAEIAASD